MSKGSRIRGDDPESRKRYADGYDRIFGKRQTVAKGAAKQQIAARLKPYPSWVCYPCGIAASGGKTLHECASYHYGTCDVCGLGASITEPRDFCYPKFPGHKY